MTEKMAGVLRRSAASALRMAKPNPTVSRRAMSGGAASGDSEFEQVWIKRDVYPIVFVLGVGAMYATYTTMRFGSAHPEVQWNKEKKSKSVSQWYESKYPGTEATAKPGIRH
uniref:Uncharacterized protein n=1 Tax=Hemiselmis tepida TaxID=464990 RepID=A0A7S0V985_9CRYP